MLKVSDNRKVTEFEYDDAGERTVKRGQQGETAYIGAHYTIRNEAFAGIHIFAGNSRVVSKFENHGQTNADSIYYYHPDHLGSSSTVTDRSGDFYEYLEYFPYGETWINTRSSNDDLPYKFTGKEFDPETGYYYYGARYFEPKMSRWVSADPILEKYLPTGDQEKDKNLPGMGGVFNPANLNMYSYSGDNPVIFVDPDGNEYTFTAYGKEHTLSTKIEDIAQSNADKRALGSLKSCATTASAIRASAIESNVSSDRLISGAAELIRSPKTVEINPTDIRKGDMITYIRKEDAPKTEATGHIQTVLDVYKNPFTGKPFLFKVIEGHRSDKVDTNFYFSVEVYSRGRFLNNSNLIFHSFRRWKGSPSR